MDRFSTLRRIPALAVLLVAFASVATAQQFQILRAEYGYGNRWVDVTQRLRELARDNATFRVSNDIFGVDPIEGQVKSLRISVRGPRGENRTFEFPERSVVDGSQFTGWREGNWGTIGGGSPGGQYQSPGGQYQIVRAEYGAGNRRVDVTRRLRELARVDRTFRAGNDALEVDPAPGRAKTLRIYARGPGGNTRTFDYREGDIVEGSQFSDWNGGGSNPGWSRPDNNIGQLNIISARYGARNRSIDVTQRVRSLIRDGRLDLTVSNSTFDDDPAPGTHKTLSVTYSIGSGRQREETVSEGERLRIP
jgi:hypothetical protein